MPRLGKDGGAGDDMLACHFPFWFVVSSFEHIAVAGGDVKSVIIIAIQCAMRKREEW
jgi:hypothetical protein